MSEHYIVTVARDNLRIYARRREPTEPSFSLHCMEAINLTGETDKKAEASAEVANSPATSACLMPSPTRFGVAYEAACHIVGFFHHHPVGSWDFFADGDLCEKIMAWIDQPLKQRLRQMLACPSASIP